MPKPKDPRTVAEDKLFLKASPKVKALLKKSRELKRAEARREWWKENRP